MTDINVGMLSESINNKADLDLGNTNPLARTVVEVSDKSLMPSWYRVYSDGWCEQGGKVSIGSQQSLIVRFLKSFLDLNYNIATTTNTFQTTYNCIVPINEGSNTTQSQVELNNSSSGLPCNAWYKASGYIN